MREAQMLKAINTKIDEKLLWWGYLHQNRTIQAKRWSGDVRDYTEDCEGNDFVVRVIEPFPADSREEAIKYIQDDLRKCGYDFKSS
jgi:hypothetical protein